MGRLVATEAVPSQRTQLDYVFLVDQVVKGELSRRVTVRSGIGTSALGFSLKRDVASGVLINRDRGLWFGGLCGQIAVGELVEATRGDEPILNWPGIVLGSLVIAAGIFFLARKLREHQGRFSP